MDSINIDLSSLSCSVEKKLESLEYVFKILELSKIARMDGIFSLEDEIKKLDNFFLSHGLSLIIDGFDSKDIRKILLNYIYADNLNEENTFCSLLMIEGVLLIQKAENPALIKEILFSYFGNNFINEYKSQIIKKGLFLRNFSQKDFQELKREYFRQVELVLENHKANDFDKKIAELSEKEINMLLREISSDDLMAILKDVTISVFKKVINTLQPYASLLFMQKYFDFPIPEKEIIIEGKNHILNLIK